MNRHSRTPGRSAAVLLLAASILVSLSGCDWIKGWFGDTKDEGGLDLHWIDGWDVNEPTWLDDHTLLMTTGFSSEFITVSYPEFTFQSSYQFTLYTDIESINLAAVSPNKQLVAVNARSYSTGDSYILTYNLTNGVETDCGYGDLHSPNFLDDDHLLFYEYQWDMPSIDEVTQNLVTFEISTLMSTGMQVPDRTAGGGIPNPSMYHWEDVDRFVEGSTYWWPRIYPDGAGGAQRILVCKHQADVDRLTFAVLDSAGYETHNGLSILNVDWIAGGDWIDANTLVLTVGMHGDYAIAKVDVSGPDAKLLEFIPLDAPGLRQPYGVHVSPDGTTGILHAWAERPQELGGGEGNALIAVPLN